MAKTMLAIGLLVGAGCSSGAAATRTAPTSEPVRTDPVTDEHPTVPTTTTLPPTTTTEAPVVEQAPPVTRAARASLAPTTVPYVAPEPVERGGDGSWAIPTAVVMCESRGSWDAENASGAAGPYQLMPEHFGGESALNQSPAAQHAKAAELWNGGVNTRSGLGPQNWRDCL